MPDAASFQQTFGAALNGRVSVADPALARALAVHRNTVIRAACEALTDNYPVIAALVGDGAFGAAASDFVLAHPPSDPRLCLYGAGFADFLGTFAPFAELSYLPDVAALERLAVEALFAANAIALEASAFENGIDLERPLRLHPATRSAAFRSPAGSIWMAHQAGASSDLEALAWRQEAVLVTRPGSAVCVTIVDNDALGFLHACAAGQTLGHAAAAVDPERLSELFATLIAAGAFA